MLIDKALVDSAAAAKATALVNNEISTKVAGIYWMLEAKPYRKSHEELFLRSQDVNGRRLAGRRA